MNATQIADKKRPWGCLIASGLMSLLGLSVLCGALILLFPPPGLRRPTATSISAADVSGGIGGMGNAISETATTAPTLPDVTATMTTTPTATPTLPTPTAP